MMGQRAQHQGQLFYSFDLNAAVPDDHLVRRIAAFWTYRGFMANWRRTIPTTAARRSIRFS